MQNVTSEPLNYSAFIIATINLYKKIIIKKILKKWVLYEMNLNSWTYLNSFFFYIFLVGRYFYLIIQIIALLIYLWNYW